MDASFEEFARARLGALTSFAFRLTGDVSRAEDLVQEALIRAGVRWRAVRRKDRPEAYVQTVIVRLNVDTWRRTRLEDLNATTADRSAAEVDHDARLDVSSALARLAPRQRAVLVLRYFYDYTEAQTADALGCARGTVKSQTSDALRRLRLQLGDTASAELPGEVATAKSGTAAFPRTSRSNAASLPEQGEKR